MLYKFKGCRKCGGDLLQDSDEWRCFQCGHAYYPRRSIAELRVEAATDQDRQFQFETERPVVRRSVRHLTPDHQVTRSNEEKWLEKNRQVIF